MSQLGRDMQRVSLQDAADVKWGDTQTTKAAYKPTGYLAYSASGPDGFMDHFDHEGPGIVLSAIGAQCGKTWYASGRWSCIKNTIYLKAKPELADTRFLFYATSLPDFWPKRGAAQPFISQGDARKCELLLPPLETQSRIASILGAYDDLIEINRRRVAVLEEMTRRLFEEWFVRFRFPGHEAVPIVDTPQGPLPGQWRVGPLRDIAVLRSGFAFKSNTFVEDGHYSLVTIKHVHDGRLVPPFESKLANLPDNMPVHCRIQVGDMLLSLTGNVGRACLAWGDHLLLNQRVAKVEAVRVNSRAFAYAWLRQPQTLKLLQQISNGVAQQNLSPVRTMDLPIVIPPPDLTSAFEKVGGPILDAIVVAHRTISTLQNQRDLLLPRLISGQLSVDAVERELEDVA